MKKRCVPHHHPLVRAAHISWYHILQPTKNRLNSTYGALSEREWLAAVCSCNAAEVRCHSWVLLGTSTTCWPLSEDVCTCGWAHTPGCCAGFLQYKPSCSCKLALEHHVTLAHVAHERGLCDYIEAQHFSGRESWHQSYWRLLTVLH